MAKALKLGLELISTGGKISQEDLKKLDALFAMDEGGNFHIGPASVTTSVETAVDEYRKQVEAAIRV